MHRDRIINTKLFSFIFLNASITINYYGKYLHVDEIKPAQSLWQTGDNWAITLGVIVELE